MPLSTRPTGDSPTRKQIAYTIAIATNDGINQSSGRRSVQPNRFAAGRLMRPYVPPISGIATSSPRITEDTASVSRMRYSTLSLSAGSATSVPMTNASTMPSSVPSRKFQPWACVVYAIV